MKILINASNHKLSENQTAPFFGVKELPEELKVKWGNVTPETINSIMESFYDFMESTPISVGVEYFVHLAGHADLIASIVRDQKFNLIYAHSERNVEEVTNEDGTVTKKSVFNFKGWYYYITHERVM